MADDDDWTGEPPEGRHSRDRARPGFWENQWQAAAGQSPDDERKVGRHQILSVAGAR